MAYIKLVLIFLTCIQGTSLAAADYPKRSGHRVLGATWQRALQSPISAPVTFFGLFNGTGKLKVELAGQSSLATNIVPGYICGSPTGWTNTPKQTVELFLFRTYTIEMSGDNLYSGQIFLQEPNLHDLLLGHGPNAQQYNRYRLYMRKNTEDKWKLACADEPLAWDTEANGSGFCDAVAVTFQLQLRPDVGARPVRHPGVFRDFASDEQPNVWDRDEDAIGATTAPGDGDPLEMTGGRSLNPDDMGFQWAVNIGRLWDGRSAGKLRIVANKLSSSLFTPSALVYLPRSYDTNELEVLNTTNGEALQQIKAPQTFVNVVTLGSDNYELHFYLPEAADQKDQNGFYTIVTNAQPFVVWRLGAGTSTDVFRIEEVRNGTTNATVLHFEGGTNNLWSLTTGSNPDFRITTRTVEFPPVGGGVTNRVEVETIKTGTGQISDRTKEVWNAQGTDWQLTEVTEGYGGPNLVTELEYETFSGSKRRLKNIKYPDGFWERREYANAGTYATNTWLPENALMRVVHPWQDSPISAENDDCHVSSYVYPENAGQGSYQLQRWHNSGAYATQVNGEEPDSTHLSKLASVTYEEETQFSVDTCNYLTHHVERRQFGDLEHYGEYITTTTHTDFSGRLGGLLFSVKSGTGATDAYDYRFGKWNAVSRTFSTGETYTNDAKHIVYHGTAVNIEPAHWTTIGESGNTIEGLYLHPYKSTKDVRIVVAGLLVAKEQHVYTGETPAWVLTEQLVYERDALGRATNVSRYDPGTTQSSRPLKKRPISGVCV